MYRGLWEPSPPNSYNPNNRETAVSKHRDNAPICRLFWNMGLRVLRLPSTPEPSKFNNREAAVSPTEKIHLFVACFRIYGVYFVLVTLAA